MADLLNDFIFSFKSINSNTGNIAYIIDHNNKIAAISVGFIDDFSLSSSNKLIGKSWEKQNIPSLKFFKTNAETLNQQYRFSIAKNYFYIMKFRPSAKLYLVNSNPIFKDNEHIGTHISMRPYVLPRLAELSLICHSKNITNDSAPTPIMLTPKQSMVLYLYLRNYSYTEVSTWMGAFGHKISPSRVNEHLARLKQIFKVQSKDELRGKGLKMGYHINMPTDFMQEGSFDITDDIVRLMVCNKYPFQLNS